MSYTILEDGHISSPQGFRATGVSCGLKAGTRARDLALIYSLYPCKAAAQFTTTVIKSASIFLSQAILLRNREALRAVLINSGHANTGTGQAGLNDAVECAKLVADELEVQRDSVLLLSTGIIGVPLPMQRMRDGIRRAVSELDSGGGRRAAVAIMTTDSRPKERAFRLQLRDGRRVTLAGIVKGSRMIHPRLATLLCIITTDLPIEQHLLARSLNQSVSRSFGRLNLDGETSPNDAVLVLANGAVEGPPISDPNSWEFGAWQAALDDLTADLAQQVLRDAAGNNKVIQIHVRNAVDEATARAVADMVALSPSVRNACMQGDPDWGALLAAVGAARVEFRPELLELRVGNLLLMREGMPQAFDHDMAVQLFTTPEIEFTIDLHQGPAATTVWTCTWHE